MSTDSRTVEIYSPRFPSTIFYRSAPMTEEHAGEVAAAYNALLSPAEIEHTGARVAAVPDRPQGRPVRVEELETQGSGYRSRVE